MSLAERYKVWLASDDTGASSVYMIQTIHIVENNSECGNLIDEKNRNNYHPLDADDLGRCFRMIQKFPELKQKISQMSDVSYEWQLTIEHWDEMFDLYDRYGQDAYELINRIHRKSLDRIIIVDENDEYYKKDEQGRRQGAYFRTYPSGFIERFNYKDNEKHGVQRTWRDGKPVQIFNCVLGKCEGIEIVFLKDGSIHSLSYFENGNCISSFPGRML